MFYRRAWQKVAPGSRSFTAVEASDSKQKESKTHQKSDDKRVKSSNQSKTHSLTQPKQSKKQHFQTKTQQKKP